MRDNNPRRSPGERRDRRFEGKREPRAAAPAPVEEEDETRLEGRNAVSEALKAGRTIDKVSSLTAIPTSPSSVWPPWPRRPVPSSSPWTAGSWT